MRMKESNTQRMRRNSHYEEIINGGKQYKKNEMAEESKIRVKVQEFIRSSVRDGYSDSDIIKFLSAKLPKFEQYLAGWIENCRKKCKIENPSRSSKDFEDLSL